MSSSDDEDLQVAIALSLQQHNAAGTADDRNSGSAPFPQSLKRERSESPPPRRNIKKNYGVEEKSVDFASGARLNFITMAPESLQPAIKRESPQAVVKNEVVNSKAKTSALQSPLLQYPNGIIKKTWAFRHERNDNDVKLEEVLEPASLRTAVLSAFQWDMDWVLSKLRLPDTKCVCIMQAKEENERESVRQQFQDYSFLRVCLPPMLGSTHCMHSKLMLLFHTHKLRIAIPTANLLNFDWGETGQMENSVFMIDLPRLPSGPMSNVENMTTFGKELLFFLDRSGLDEQVRAGLLKFDFSATQNMAFVHSIGGTLFDHEAEKTGLASLANGVRSLNLQTNELEIDFAASSIGSLNDDFLRNVHAAASGEDMFAREQDRQKQTKADFFRSRPDKAEVNSGNVTGSRIRDLIRIYFPTQETVRASTAGTAGTICLAKRWFEGAKFPRSCFRDYVSTRSGLLSHNKIFCARGKQHVSDSAQHVLRPKKDVAWVYIGSANMSESAWGKISFDAKQRKKKITCRNWECGVILPVPLSATQTTETSQASARSVLPSLDEPYIKTEDSSTESEASSSPPQSAVPVRKAPRVTQESRSKVKSGSLAPDSVTASEDERAISCSSKTPQPPSSANSAPTSSPLLPMTVFESVISLPFQVPGQRYGTREPWYFKD